MNNSGPSIEIIPIGNSGYAKTENIKIKVTAAGTALDEGSFAYALSTSSTAEPDTTFMNNTNLNIPALTGQYYIIARACDMDSNCSLMISNKFYFDNTSPEIKYEPNGTSSAWRKSQAVNITVTDNIELDWAKYIISTDKTATPTIAISSGSVNPTISGLTGIYYIVTKGCDKLGNCSMSNSDKYYFDNTLPTIDISIDKKNATIKLKDVHSGLSGYKVTTTTDVPTSWDPVSGVNADVNKTFVATSAGTYYVHVKDTAGNINRKEFEIPANAFCNAQPGDYWEFFYTGNIQEFEVPCDGNYKLEVWGAQGGNLRGKSGGLGGYSVGYKEFEMGELIYIGVGGQGSGGTAGYNGGGRGTAGTSNPSSGRGQNGVSGGGATHMAMVTGTIVEIGKTVFDQQGLLVAGGGGGSGGQVGWEDDGSSAQSISGGGSGGGTSGGGASFGQGGSNGSGGGGGYTGGSGGYYNGGRGGLGWIGGVKYGITSNGQRSGNGYARINFEGVDSCLEINESKIFNYTGALQEFKVMCDGTYKLEVWGAAGGTNNYAGGKGGYASGTTNLTTGLILYIGVGGAGASSVRTGEWTTWCLNTTYTAGSTFNGGAQGYASCHMDHVSYECHYALSGSGGGATHIGTFDTTLAAHASDSGLYIVAGGGGGGMYSHEPKENGGSDRSWGASGNPGCDSNSGTTGTYGSGSGPSGGGGYKGGAACSWDHNGGRGGSCYVGGVSNGQIIAGNASMPTYDGTSTMTGNSGNGVAKITRIA